MARNKQTIKTKRQQLIRMYREETGQEVIDMHAVAKFAVSNGWQLPMPKDPISRLAEQFASAAREETRIDQETGRPYRANLAVVDYTSEGDQFTLWGDIDKSDRPFANKALVQRREHMVGEAVQMTLDIDHWNRVNPAEEPINMPMDFTDDVEERLIDLDDDEEAA